MLYIIYDLLKSFFADAWEWLVNPYYHRQAAKTPIKTCYYCGVKVKETDVFCEHCGGPII